jgi:non-homologous end joining protein Ku
MVHPTMLEDHYKNALVRILRRRQAKMPLPPEPVAPSRENVINLMDTLRRRIDAELPPTKPAADSRISSTRRRNARRR